MLDIILFRIECGLLSAVENIFVILYISVPKTFETHEWGLLVVSERFRIPIRLFKSSSIYGSDAIVNAIDIYFIGGDSYNGAIFLVRGKHCMIFGTFGSDTQDPQGREGASKVSIGDF